MGAASTIHAKGSDKVLKIDSKPPQAMIIHENDDGNRRSSPAGSANSEMGAESASGVDFGEEAATHNGTGTGGDGIDYHRTITSSDVSEACAAAAEFQLSMTNYDFQRTECFAPLLMGGRQTRNGFYVDYVPEIFGREVGNVVEWFFPHDFCQSRLGDRQIGSNACTLIIVILAHRVHDLAISVRGFLDEPLSPHLISSLAESIVDGNEIHQRLVEMGKLTDINLTLPEAMLHYARAYESYWIPPIGSRQAVESRCMVEWRSTLVPQTMTPAALFETLHRGLFDWEVNGRNLAIPDNNLYVALIADGRSVLFVYDRKIHKVTMIDSHAHGSDLGAVVAQADLHKLEQLSVWFCNMWIKYTSNLPQFFEVAFLYFAEKTFPDRTRSGSLILIQEADTASSRR